MRLTFAFLMATFLSATAVLAQVDRASLGGTVRDESGAALPGAAVTVTHVKSGLSQSLVTQADGGFLAVGLAPGEYRVEAEVRGFQKRLESLILEVGQKARLDVRLG